MFDERITYGFWKSTNNHRYECFVILTTTRRFFAWLMIQLEYRVMEDWYNVKKEDILKRGGGGLLNYYHSSLSVALQNVYPEHIWELQKFKYKSPLWLNKL